MSAPKLQPVSSSSPAAQTPETRSAPPVKWVATGVYLFSILMVAGGILLAPVGQPTRWFDEKQTMTSYSAALLYTCILICALNFLAARRFGYPRSHTRSLAGFWAMGTFGFFVLMLDEFFVMHEGVGGFLTYRLLRLAKTPFLDHFDGFIVAFYGLCALAILAAYWRDLKAIPGFAKFLAIGGVFGLISVTMDIGGETLWDIYVEEGAKILANASFVLACLTATLKNYGELRNDLHALRAGEPSMSKRPSLRREGLLAQSARRGR